MNFSITVIIPVYNAEKYLSTAVESAVNLKEVGEVILIEDASPDDALAICKELEIKYKKVKLYRHPNGENRGAGASRNLGIQKSTFEFIAFLDADDWYLPNRFNEEKHIFQNPQVDGVYGATGYYYENTKEIEKGLTTIPLKLPPEDLLYHLLNKKGHFHLNAFTIKKDLLYKVGLFNTALKLHQDMHLFYKLAHHAKLYAGNIEEAVAIRRVHDENRVHSINLKTKAQLRLEVYKTFKKYKGVNKAVSKKIYQEYIRLKYFRMFYELKEYVSKILKRK